MSNTRLQVEETEPQQPTQLDHAAVAVQSVIQTAVESELPDALLEKALDTLARLAEADARRF